MKFNQYFTFLALSVLLFTGCTEDEAARGTLRLSITDAPLDNSDIVAVNLAIKRVDVNGPSGWEVLETYENTIDVNLLDYQAGNSLLLTEETLEAGRYSEIRLVLDIAEKEGGDAANRGTYLEYIDGSREPLFVPSGESSGYKVKGDFDIPAGGVTGLTVDFDARRAVVEAGNSGKYILKPVTRLVEDEDVALINGSTSTETDLGLVRIFAYRDGTFTEDELVAEPESVEFPNAITSDTINPDGTFTLAFMDSGVYDLVVVRYDEENDPPTIITIVEGVELAPGEVMDFNLTLD